MKKKGSREIPDFSRHPTRQSGGVPVAPMKAPPPPTAPRPTAKPQATSAKSGRRGQ